eukprot:1583374-Pyramimonas_sp.AAC.1
MARWHSPMLLHYAKEAPLNKITKDFVEKKSLLHANEALQTLRVRLDELAAKEKQYTSSATNEAIAILESKINEVDTKTAAALERDINNLKNGICAPATGAVIENDATGSGHAAAIEGLHITPGPWRTKCGWRFSKG